jgi:hypothetical protein
MKISKVFAFLTLFLILPITLLAQKKMTTYVGSSYALETNVGFHGLMFNLEEEAKLNQSLQFVLGLNLFYSNNIPDRRNLPVRQFNKSLITDFCVQFKPNSKTKNGLVLSIGPAMRFSKIRQVKGYSVTENGTPININIREGNSSGIGLKVGLGYKFMMSKNLSSNIFLDSRFIDNIPEPTFLNLGYKLGF